jgi:hypothetical protein
MWRLRSVLAQSVYCARIPPGNINATKYTGMTVAATT